MEEEDLKAVTRPDGPRHGTRRHAQRLLDGVDELEGFERRPIHLVDEREEGKLAELDDVEEFEGLGLEAFGPVEKHHCVVRSLPRTHLIITTRKTIRSSERNNSDTY